MILPHVARFLLWLGGWTVVGDAPNVRKAVLIAAPHTSNWDGFWAIVFKVYIGLKIHWFVKDSMFWFPMSSLLGINGAIPLDRKRSRSAVAQAIASRSTRTRISISASPRRALAAKRRAGRVAFTV